MKVLTIVIVILVGLHGIAHALAELPSEAELNTRIAKRASEAQRRKRREAQEADQRRVEALHRNGGRTYWGQDSVSVLMRLTGKSITAAWSQQKQGPNGRWQNGTSSIYYTDGDLFCKSAGLTETKIPLPAYRCYDLSGNLLYYGRIPSRL